MKIAGTDTALIVKEIENMKKLWLNALTASLILGAVSISAGAQAGDHHRDHDRHDRHHYSHHRHHDNWHGHRGHGYVAVREYRPVYYRPAPVYYRPARYYSEPVYRERVGYRDDVIHGSITVGF
jgi:hypothetical protein